MLILNPSTTRFATHFPRMMRTLRLKNSLRGTVHLQEFIALNLSNEEVTFAMIKDDQYFHQSHIFIKMEIPLLIIMRMSDSNQTHMENIRFMVLMVDNNIRMSMPELNDEYYPPSTSCNRVIRL